MNKEKSREYSSFILHPSSFTTGLVGFAVLCSRILGLVREQLFAAMFGAAGEYDAFVTAFRIPNLLRDLFAEGTLSAAFVPVFSKRFERDGARAAWVSANRVLNVLLLMMIPTVLLGILFSPNVIDLIAPGFAEFPAKRGLTIELAQWMWPFTALVFVAAWVMGLLNSRERYAASSFASAFFNIGAVFGGLLCAWLLAPSYVGTMLLRALRLTDGLADMSAAPRAVFGMALGTLVGGALQLGVQLPSLRTAGFRWRPTFDLFDPDVRQALKLLLPAALGGAATQINVFVNGNFASQLGDGAVGRLNYAFRLIQFPVGIFGVAIATTTLPILARAFVRNDLDEFRKTISNALGLVFVLCLPSACGLIVLRELIVAVVYEHGRFTPLDTRETAAALAWYSLGLVGYAAVKVLSPAFYALDDARTPILVSVGSILLNLALNWLLVRELGFGIRGLALSTSLVVLAEFTMLVVMLRRRAQWKASAGFFSWTGRIVLASAGLGATAWVIARTTAPTGFLGRAALLASAMAGAGLVFTAACKLLRVEEFNRVVESFSRRR